MSFYYSPKIVTDGLILYIDAANSKSYPSTGTDWFDLTSNNNDGVLTNGPTFDSANGGSISFDGFDDYAPVGGSTPSSLQGNPSFTVEGWFKRNGDSSGAAWGIGGDSNNSGISTYSFPANPNEITIDLWGNTTYTTNQTYSLTEWKHCAWTYNGTTFTDSNIVIYINTIAYTGVNLSTLRLGSVTPNINSNGIVLGRAGRNTSSYYGKPIISNLRIYDRVLSPTEVRQNYNTLKTRFGL